MKHPPNWLVITEWYNSNLRETSRVGRNFSWQSNSRNLIFHQRFVSYWVIIKITKGQDRRPGIISGGDDFSIPSSPCTINSRYFAQNPYFSPSIFVKIHISFLFFTARQWDYLISSLFSVTYLPLIVVSHQRKEKSPLHPPSPITKTLHYKKEWKESAGKIPSFRIQIGVSYQI